MLLQIVAFARDVADDLEAVGQPHLGDLAQRRIRLFRRRRVNAGANSPLLRACLEMARLLAVDLGSPRLADQLANRRHARPSHYRPNCSRRSAGLDQIPSLIVAAKAPHKTDYARETRAGFGRLRQRTADDAAIVRNRTGPTGAGVARRR